MVTKVVNLPLHYGVVEANGDRITRIDEKPVVNAEVNAGIYFMHPRTLGYIPNEKYDMPTLLQELLRHDERVCRFLLTGSWLDIGQLEDYDRAQDYAKRLGFDRSVDQ